MKLIKLFSSAVLVVSSIAVLHAQDEAPKITRQRINDHFYVLFGGNGQGSNVGVSIGIEGILLIDAMVADSDYKLLKAVREISDKPIKYVINTHSDSDHAGGNTFFARMGAAIILQENARYGGIKSDLNFQEKLTLDIGNEVVEARHVVSHSIDDAIIYLSKSNVLLMGDTFTNTWHPTFYSGGMEGQNRAIDLALSLGDQNTIVVPGHGFVTDKQGLLKYKADSIALIGRVGEMFKKGLSVDEIIKDKKLNRIKLRFNGAMRKDFIPAQNLKRFVQRVISTELVTAFPISADELSRYVGVYEFEGDDSVEIFQQDGRLIARNPSEAFLMAQLIPLSEKKFHIRGDIGKYYSFEIGRDGKVESVILYDGAKNRRAIRKRAASRR